MAACMKIRDAPQSSAYIDSLSDRIANSRIFVVGAGGIGCELLKNLVMAGFPDVHVIDLDTIDVSNLNRQFLFRKEHVGKSKAQIAKESVSLYKKGASITAYHDTIFNTQFGVDFYKGFDIVVNALDNRAARNHVNRMCLAARVPLVEAGTAGYLGQVQVIVRGLTECYECQPKPAQKTFPGCTIRNTPSEPIHCIVWAKHLFNQLFGEEDSDQDVSPDTEDPELAGDAGKSVLEKTATNGGDIQRMSTRAWAMDTDYNPQKLFNKLFRDDIKYLLSMENLWKTRQPPEPLDLAVTELTEQNVTESEDAVEIADQKVWTKEQCTHQFRQCLHDLKNKRQSSEDGTLIWDKDDKSSMDFVVSAANLRMFAFHILPKSRFDIKSMAGNIIPAIATTNAIIAGVQVMEILKILSGNLERCKSTYLVRKPNPHKMLLNPCVMDKPNPKCYVCSAKPEVILKVNPLNITLLQLQEKVLKQELGMHAPDVELDDGKGTILISSEEGETDDNHDKRLQEFGIAEGSRLKCDDYLQDYSLVIVVNCVSSLEDNALFQIIVDKTQLNAKPEALKSQNGTKDDSDDDMEVIDEPLISVLSGRKRAASPIELDHKKQRLENSS